MVLLFLHCLCSDRPNALFMCTLNLIFKNYTAVAASYKYFNSRISIIVMAKCQYKRTESICIINIP